MKVSIIVAESENHVIGKDNQLPWHLPADLKHFKNLTMGHHIIMGRKTYESIGKPLPGRTSVIVTRNKDYKVEGCITVHSIKEAIEVASKAGDDEAFIIGGAELINSSENFADKLYLTIIHQQFEGDVFLNINFDNWKLEKNESHSKDEKNPYNYSFLLYHKR
ncbi:MAG: dihydrofolate reductase [Cytophagaceae bacterium]